jgi:hypothetical protein
VKRIIPGLTGPPELVIPARRFQWIPIARWSILGAEAAMYRFGSTPCRSWVTATALCLFLPIVGHGEGPESEKVTVKIRPLVLFAGRDVTTTVRAPRDPRNRALRIVVEGSDFYASSDVQLDGVDAATTHRFTWKELPGGAYRVDAILLRADGERTTVTSCFAVLGGDDGDSIPTPTPGRRRQPQPPKAEATPIRSGC